MEVMIRQRNGDRDGSQAGERPELGDLGGESGMAIIGQELVRLVPATTNPAKGFDAPSSRTALASSLHRSSATDAMPNGEHGGEGQLVVSSRVFSVAIDTPETPQSAPVGQPQSFGPVPRRLMNESSHGLGVEKIGSMAILFRCSMISSCEDLQRSIVKHRWFSLQCRM